MRRKSVRTAVALVFVTSCSDSAVVGPGAGGPGDGPTADVDGVSSAIINANRGADGRGPLAGFTHVLEAKPGLFGACEGRECLAGAIPATSSVDHGDYRYTVPLNLPRGRAGLQPSLALTYSSAAGNGPLGVGWAIAGLSAISRCDHNVARDGFAAGFDFNTDHGRALNQYCLDGNKLVPTARTGTTVLYQTERATFAKIVANFSSPTAGDPDSFTVTMPNGLIRSYGATEDSRATAPELGAGTPVGGPPSLYAWQLSQTKDRDGNTIDFTYISDPGSPYLVSATGLTTPGSTRYLSTIKYANRVVKLIWEVRPDPTSAFTFGFDLSMNRRLARVEIWSPSGGQLPASATWTYQLGYTKSQFTNRSRLASIRLSDSFGASMPPTTFTWNDFAAPADRPAWGDARDFKAVAGPVIGGTMDGGVVHDVRDRPILGDFDGDGRDDVIVAAHDDRAIGKDYLYMCPGAAGGLGPCVDVSDVYAATTPRRVFLDRAFASDLDGDGRAELFLSSKGLAAGADSAYRVYKWRAATPTQSAGLALTSISGLEGLPITSTGTGTFNNFSTRPIEVADFNGDGIPDLVTGMADPSNPRSARNIYLGKGNLAFAPPIPGPPPDGLFHPDPTFPGTDYVSIGDLNGDRRADVWHSRNANALMADMNGDGVADLFDFSPMNSVAECGSTAVKFNVTVMYARVYGTFDYYSPPGYQFNKTLVLPPLTGTIPVACTPGPVTAYQYRRSIRAGDFNGDGVTDLLLLNPGVGGKSPWLPSNHGIVNVSYRTPPVALMSTGADYVPVTLPFRNPRLRQIAAASCTANCGNVDWDYAAVGDVNGDGLADLVQFVVGALSKTELEVITANTGAPGPTDRHDYIRQVQTGDQQSLRHRNPNIDTWWPRKFETITFADLPALATAGRYSRPAASCGPNAIGRTVCATRGPRVVDSWNRAGGFSEIEYRYEAARIDPKGRGTLGFDKVIANDFVSGTRTSSEQKIFCSELALRDNFGLSAFASTTALTRTTGYVAWNEGVPGPLIGRVCFAGQTQVETVQHQIFERYPPPGANEPPGLPLRRTVVASTFELGTNVPTAPEATGTFDIRPYVKRNQEARDAVKVTEIYVPNAVSGDDTKAPDVERVVNYGGYDSFGNPLVVTRATLGGTSDVVSRTYNNDTTAWLIGQLKYVEHWRTNASGRVTRSTGYDYWPSGRVKKVEVEPALRPDNSPNASSGPDTNLVAAYTYDPANGNLTKVDVTGIDRAVSASPQTRTTSLTYDSTDKVFVKTVTDAVGTTTYNFNASLGVPIAVVDPNGVGVDFVYDGLGRKLGAFPDGGQAILEIEEIYNPQYDPLAGPNDVTQRRRSRRISIPKDGVCAGDVELNGRCLQTVEMDISDDRTLPSSSHRRALDGTYHRFHQTFDARGRMDMVVLPTLPGGGPGALGYTAAYDGLDRPRYATYATNSADHPGQSARVTWSYTDMFHTDRFDRSGQKVTTTTNADGQVTLTEELVTSSLKAGTVSVKTSQTYDAFGNVLVQTRTAGTATRQTAHTYDSLGRTTSVTDEASGTRSFLYNSFGELRQQKDAINSRTLVHDALGRLTRRVDDANAARYDSFVWDTAANGLGKLHSAVSMPDDVTRTLRYLGTGRLWTDVVAFGASTATPRTYGMQFSYDTEGRVYRTWYPTAPGGRLQIKNLYTTFGELYQVDMLAPTAQTLWTRTERTPYGSKETSGDNAVTTYSADWMSRRLSEIRVDLPSGQNLQRYRYTYDGAGNVKTRDELVNGVLESFTYDSMDRLESWRHTVGPLGEAKFRREYSYDAFGGMTEANTFNALTGGTNIGRDKYTLGQTVNPGNRYNPDAIASAIGSEVASYVHDGLGRRIRTTSSASTATDYNYWNLPTKITPLDAAGNQRDSAKEYKYDAFGRRALYNEGHGGLRYYHGDSFQDDSQSGVYHSFLHRIAVAGRTVAEVYQSFWEGDVTSTTALRYPHQEALGSTSLVTGAAVAPARFFYEPFGKLVAPDGLSPAPSAPGNRNFTGHENEGVANLINMRGRIYDSSTRRFLSPDPVVVSPLRSQGHAPYSYVVNNPLRYTDPSGFVCTGNSIQSFAEGGRCIDLNNPVEIVVSGQRPNMGNNGWYGQGVGSQGAGHLTARSTPPGWLTRWMQHHNNESPTAGARGAEGPDTIDMTDRNGDSFFEGQGGTAGVRPGNSDGPGGGGGDSDWGDVGRDLASRAGNTMEAASGVTTLKLTRDARKTMTTMNKMLASAWQIPASAFKNVGQAALDWLEGGSAGRAGSIFKNAQKAGARAGQIGVALDMVDLVEAVKNGDGAGSVKSGADVASHVIGYAGPVGGAWDAGWAVGATLDGFIDDVPGARALQFKAFDFGAGVMGIEIDRGARR